jgi:hypothetical protein
MERYLIVYRGAPDATDEVDQQQVQRWDSWFDGLGARVLDRGSQSHASVAIDTRLAGPKTSSDALAGYSVLAAVDFNEAVKLAEQCPIFDQHGSVEIARLDH